MHSALSPGAYAVGAVGFAFTLGCVIAAAGLVRRTWLEDVDGAARWTAMSMLSIFGLLIVEVVPLLLGVLSRVTAPLAALALLLAAWVTTRHRTGGNRRGRAARTALWPKPSISLGLAGIGLLAASAIGLAFLTVAATIPIQSTDALNFHLPGVIGFIRSGSLWHVSQFLPGQAQANYPLNGDMLMLALALPWHSSALVRYVDAPLLVITGVALYATARELSAPAGPSILASLALLSIGPVLYPALQDVQADTCFLAGFASGSLFLARHGRTGDRRDLVLAGLGLGVAFGTKWYGLTDIPAVLLVWVLTSWRARGQLRAVLGDLGVIVAFAALSGGIWLVRNIVLTGDPVFDYRLKVFGLTIFPAPPATLRARVGFSLAHYATDFGVLRRHIWPGFRQQFGPSALLMVVGAVGALVPRAWKLPGGARFDRRVVGLAASALLCAIAYAVTPYSALGPPGSPQVGPNARYGVPALMLATPLLALWLGRLRPILRIGLEVLVLTSLLRDLHQWIWTSWGRVLVFAAVITALIGGFWLLRGVGVNLRRPVWATGAVAAAGLVIVLGAYHYQRVQAGRRYVFPDPTIGYVLHRDPTGVRIGLTGIWLPYGVEPPAPLFGPRFGNLVGFVGPFREHRLELYPGPAPFMAALRRDHYRLLEIGTGDPAMRFPPEFYWARRAGYRMVIRSRRLILMQAAA